MKTRLIFLSVFLIFSCKSKKEFTEIKHETRVDSTVSISKEVDRIFKGVIIEKTKPIYSQTIIEKPCDSLGNVIPINIVIGSGGNKASIVSKDGKLYIQQIIDSTVQVYEQQYQEKHRIDSLRVVNQVLKQHSQTSKKVVYVYPWWLYAVIIGGILFLILWLIEKFRLYRVFV